VIPEQWIALVRSHDVIAHCCDNAYLSSKFEGYSPYRRSPAHDSSSVTRRLSFRFSTKDVLGPSLIVVGHPRHVVDPLALAIAIGLAAFQA
jgi:hypothetical protein